MLGQASNPTLEQAEQAIQSKVKPEFQAQLQRAVTAGLHILYAPELREALQHRIESIRNPPEDTGKGAQRMVYTLYQQSKGKLPKEILVPTAMILAFEFLDLLAKAGKVEITPELIAKTTEATGDAMLAAMRITPDKIAAMTAKAQAGGTPAGAASQGAPAPAPQGIIGGARAGA